MTEGCEFWCQSLTVRGSGLGLVTLGQGYGFIHLLEAETESYIWMYLQDTVKVYGRQEVPGSEMAGISDSC